MVVVKKGNNINKSNLVLNNSYENKRYKSRIRNKGDKIRYYFKYMILFKSYTLFLFLLNLIKKIILFRY